MSLFTDASLVLVPSGIKNQKIYSIKPTDGSGDLTFSRASNATRVNSSGLVEKVRTNLLLQSNSFDTTWGNDDSTETSGQSGYDGTNNAWLLSKTAANGRIGQVISVSGFATFSIYLKAGTKSWVRLASSDVNVYAYFDLGTGVVGSIGASTTAKISSVGNGFYRCSISGNSSFSYFNIWVADADNDTSGTSGNILIQNAQLETGDIATDYIATTSAAVSVGPVSGLPRLDYSGGASCPSLLLEPQRTNLATYSEQFDNAAWTKDATTATANAAISPDGYTNADKIFETAVTDYHRIYGPTISVTSGTAYTASIFVKAAEVTTFAIEMRLTSNVEDSTFDLVAGTATGNGIIQDYGNGWYRCILTGTATATGGGRPMFFLKQRSSYAGNTSNGILVYGAQFEAGAYATSYIPTLSTAVTRVQEGAYKSSISSLIGQTEGVAFIDFVWNGLTGTGSYPRVLELWEDSSNYLQFYTVAGDANVYWEIKNAGVVQFTGNTSMSLGHNKIAIGYKLNDMVIYKNGSLIASDATCTVPSTSALGVAGSYAGSGAQLAASVNQFLLFPTRLSNADLATLTTI